MILVTKEQGPSVLWHPTANLVFLVFLLFLLKMLFLMLPSSLLGSVKMITQ